MLNYYFTNKMFQIRGIIQQQTYTFFVFHRIMSKHLSNHLKKL